MPKPLTEEEIADLGPDDLAKIEEGEDGNPVWKDQEPDPEPEPKPEDKDTEPEPKADDQDKDKEPKDEEPTDPEAKKDDEPGEPEKKDEPAPDETEAKRVADAQRALHEEREARKRVERQLADQKAETERLKRSGTTKDELDEWNALSDQEKEEAWEDDPTRARRLERAALREEQATVERETREQQDRMARQDTEVVNFVKDVKGFDPNTPEGARQYQEYLASDEFNRVRDYLRSKLLPDDGGVWTADDVRNAHFIVNRDTILQETRKSAREQTLNDIEKAGKNTSGLDRTPKSDTKTDAGAGEFDHLKEMYESGNVVGAQTEIAGYDEAKRTRLGKWLASEMGEEVAA